MPEMTIDGREAVVAGVTFTWSLRCWKCREVAQVARGDGRVRAGLNASASGRTCRWFQRDLPGRMPEVPAACAHCGNADRPFQGSAREARAVASCACGYLALLDRAYGVFRACFPTEAAAADEAMRRALR